MADLRATRLSKRFSGIRVVNDVNLTIKPGEVVGYLGPNGSGKTTTARMLGGLLEPSGGVVEYDGVDIRADVVGFHRSIGYVPEEPYLYPFLSGREPRSGRSSLISTPSAGASLAAARSARTAAGCP